MIRSYRAGDAVPVNVAVLCIDTEDRAPAATFACDAEVEIERTGYCEVWPMSDLGPEDAVLLIDGRPATLRPHGPGFVRRNARPAPSAGAPLPV